MSDSIKKYHELVEEGRIDPNTSYEDKREAKILALISQAAKANKLYEVYTRAEAVKKEFGTTSLLLGLEIAVDEICQN